MRISADTKIGTVLNADSRSLEAIVSINNKFNKLKNPVIRKLMANRTSLSQAARIGGCEVDAFFRSLEPLGFEIDRTCKQEQSHQRAQKPEVLKAISSSNVVSLDVRETLNRGTDPLQVILKTVGELKKGQVLKLITTFEPTPLMSLLEKKGFASFSECNGHSIVETTFYRTAVEKKGDENSNNNDDWEAVLSKFQGKTVYSDVRHLEMPKPMITILQRVSDLPADHLLFVYHKKFPMFLIDELKNRGFSYRCKEVEAGNVHVAIFKED